MSTNWQMIRMIIVWHWVIVETAAQASLAMLLTIERATVASQVHNAALHYTMIYMYSNACFLYYIMIKIML